MDALYRRILFFLLIPIYVPIGIFMNLTFEWWQKLLKKGNASKKLLHAILGIIYHPLKVFMHNTYGWWTDLAK